MKKRTLKIVSALIWYAGAISMTAKGGQLLFSAYHPDYGAGLAWSLLTSGVLLGLVKAKLVLHRFCLRNLARIELLDDPKWWQFYSPGFLIALAIMITAGVVMSRVAQGHFAGQIVVGSIDILLGSGLLVSGVAFLQKADNTRPPIDG